MTHREGHEHSEIGIVEAVETLTSIADLELDSPIAVTEHHEMELQELPIIYRTVHWLHRKNAEKVMYVVKDTFRVILNYLKYFYKREYGKLIKHESVEGIKTIMVLVGEAAKKVDKYSHLFVGANAASIKETPEFRDLWTFYQRKIAPIAVQESLSKWMSLLPFKVVQEVSLKKEKKVLPEVKLEHLFVDLDTVKRDTEYELFLIRKEDGSRFFNPRLLRNIKLVCNFEEYYEEEAREPTIQELSVWKDLSSQLLARNILRYNWLLVDQFFKNGTKIRNNDSSQLLYKAILALMLAANQGPSHKPITKGASRYLYDFQRFMHELLTSTDFQRYITYPPKNEESIVHKTIELAEQFCRYLFSGFHLNEEAAGFLNELIIKGKEEISQSEHLVETPESFLSSKMAIDYEALVRALRHYGHVPLVAILDVLQNPEITGFDPLILQNLPSAVFDLFPKGKKISVLRLASPTSQEYINKAHVAEEFKAYLRALEGETHLLFNMQDRTQWKEFARSHALEELQSKEDFHKKLCVVSMTKESEFYHQTGPYADLNQAGLFIEQLLEHVESENSGYFYPPKVKKALFPQFAHDLAAAILSVFFGNKNVLVQNARQDFIELFYFFLELKIIEIIQPACISFSCKDAIDIGMPATCALFLLLKMLNDRPLSSEEEEYLKVMLYVPAIAYRGRNLFAERFMRLHSLLRRIESCREELSPKGLHHALGEQITPLYDVDTLTAVVALPQPLL